MAARIALFAATASACIFVAQSAEGQANKSTAPIATPNQKVPPIASTPAAPQYEDEDWTPSESEKAEAAAKFERTRVLAEQGDVKARRQLAYKYNFGVGVPKNPVLAWQWYRRIADSGDVLIQHIVGETYLYGDEDAGVIIDRAEAAKWYRRAAEQGDGLGQHDLGRLYEEGWGVPKDDVLAYMWYNLAAAKEGGSFSPAASHRDTLAEHMTPAQIAEGQRLTREWKPKPETPRPEKLGWWQWALDFFR
jgi:uncharacterized protein